PRPRWKHVELGSPPSRRPAALLPVDGKPRAPSGDERDDVPESRRLRIRVQHRRTLSRSLRPGARTAGPTRFPLTPLGRGGTNALRGLRSGGSSTVVPPRACLSRLGARAASRLDRTAASILRC